MNWRASSVQAGDAQRRSQRRRHGVRWTAGVDGDWGLTMRSIDNKDRRKHLKAMRSIRPCCSAKLVLRTDGEVATMRFLIDWRGRRIRAGLVIGGLVDGEPKLSDVGMLCLDQWMRAHPTQTIVFAEFKQVATGNTERMRSLLIERLDRMAAQGDNALLLLAAKNSTMYDKIGALIGIGARGIA